MVASALPARAEDSGEEGEDLMWQRLRLKQRIYLILAVMVAVSAGAGIMTIWYTYRVENMITTLIDSHVAVFEAAEALENALINQKGYVSYFFLDSDPNWLEQLDRYRAIFNDRMVQVSDLPQDQEGYNILSRIEQQYEQYIHLKDQVIEQFKAGQRNASTALNQQVRNQYFDILNLCEQYKNKQIIGIRSAQRNTNVQAVRLRVISAAVAIAGFLLVAVLALILARQILNPISKMLRETFSC